MSDKDKPSTWAKAIERVMRAHLANIEWFEAPQATPEQLAALARAAWAWAGKPRVVLNPDVETERADPVLRVVEKR